MKLTEEQRTFGAGTVTDLAGFMLGMLIAWHLNWSTRDLVWSLWLSSLCVGYCTMLAMLGAGLYLGSKLTRDPAIRERERGKVVMATVFIALCLLSILSFPFSAFHAEHGAVLSSFFPLNGIASSVFSEAISETSRLLSFAARDLAPQYGLFAASILIGERSKILEPISKARAVKIMPISSWPSSAKDMPLAVRRGVVYVFFAPYRNVITAQCLLFFFAFTGCFRLDSPAVFLAAYAVYFFPDVLWTALRRNRRAVK